ncbi:MAG: Zinc ribbon domain protein [Pelotomaculum sp. PtaU1.Bin035]|nr:MAG: Zinc ribbon domain protein [Pelotomaculum sp. PtaU1.Bin035]
MPIYEFRCGGCGGRFEKLCPIGENGENLKCPACGVASPRRVMSSFSGGGNSGDSGCSTCGSSNCSSCRI